MRLDGLGVLNSLSEGVLNIAGPLVDRIGSVDIVGIVSLQIVPSASASQNRMKPDRQDDPSLLGSDPWWNNEENTQVRASNVTPLDHDRLPHTQKQPPARSPRLWV